MSSRLLGYLSQNSGPREGIQAGPGPWGDLHKSVGPWTSMPSSLRWVCPGTTLWSADHVSGKGLTWRQGRQRSLRSWGTARGFPERSRPAGGRSPQAASVAGAARQMLGACGSSGAQCAKGPCTPGPHFAVTRKPQGLKQDSDRIGEAAWTIRGDFFSRFVLLVHVGTFQISYNAQR